MLRRINNNLGGSWIYSTNTKYPFEIFHDMLISLKNNVFVDAIDIDIIWLRCNEFSYGKAKTM